MEWRRKRERHHGVQLYGQQMVGRIHHSTTTHSYFSDSKYRKLDRKTRHQTRIFRLVVTLSFLVVVVYIGLIVFLIAAGARRKEDSNPQPQTAEGRDTEPKFCMQKEYLESHRDVYTTSKRRHSTKDNEKVICFHSLDWMPKLAEKVKSGIQNRAAKLEDKHRKMHTDLDNINARLNHTPNSSRERMEQNLTNRRNPVFAHLYLDWKADHSTSLKWSLPELNESNPSNVNVNMSSGEIVVREAGPYFVYSHVTFSIQNGAQLFHTIERSAGGSTEVLLEGSQGPMSVLQGVFKLKKDDRLSVKVSHRHLDIHSPNSTFFGTYLMKT